jgi:5'-3' exonuclease
MIKDWEARIALEMEADDALGIGQGEGTIIASIDKDLLQVPGLHYNFVKKEFNEIIPIEGIRNFYKQVLTGDTTDNIKGCIKIGAVKSEQALQGKGTEAEMFQRVKELYLEQYKRYQPDWSEEQVMDYLRMTGQVLKIKQSEDEELWELPIEDSLSETEGQETTTMGEGQAS